MNGIEQGLDAIYDDLVLAGPAAGGDRAAVSVGMVASVDGATAVAGRAHGLGGPGDQVAFGRLRAACDAVLVGAGTVRAEDYGPPTGDHARRAVRRAAGLAPVPALVVVTARADLRPDARIFSGDGAPPVVVTNASAPTEHLDALNGVADVVVLGEDAVDLAELTRWCHRRGWDRLLCEGGPTLNGGLAAADLIDEVFVTIAPVLVGGDARRLVSGPELVPPRPLDLVELRAHEDELLARYRTRR